MLFYIPLFHLFRQWGNNFDLNKLVKIDFPIQYIKFVRILAIHTTDTLDDIKTISIYSGTLSGFYRQSLSNTGITWFSIGA